MGVRGDAVLWGHHREGDSFGENPSGWEWAWALTKVRERFLCWAVKELCPAQTHNLLRKGSRM